MYQGKLIRVKINGEYIPCEISCSITINQETLQVTNNNQGRAKSFIRGYYDWSVSLETKTSANSLDSSSIGLINKILQDGDGVIEFEMVAGGDGFSNPFIISGEAIPTQVGINSNSTGSATTPITLQGSGELTVDFDAFALIINAMPIEADKPYIVQW